MHVGDTLTVLPGNETASVKSILVAGKEADTAQTGTAGYDPVRQRDRRLKRMCVGKWQRHHGGAEIYDNASLDG